MSPTQDPTFAQLAALAGVRPSGLSRRGFLRGVGASGAVVAGAGVLAGCATPAQTPGGGTSASDDTVDQSDTDKLLNFSNWQLYIDVDEKDENKRPTLDAFTAKTGVKVNYTEDINDNASFYAKIAPQLEAGQDSGRDLFAVTDWMASRMIREGLVQTMDQSAMTNYPKNLSPALQAPSWDPKREYSAPWQSGLTGIAYNAKITGPVNSMSELLTRADLKGKVTCLTEMRDTMGLILLDQGKDPANFTAEDYDAALAMLQASVDSNHIRQFTGNEYAAGLTAGRHRCVRCLVGGRHPAPARERRHQVRGTRGWLDALVGQHADPDQGQAQEERAAPHRLLLRPGRRRRSWPPGSTTSARSSGRRRRWRRSIPTWRTTS